MAFPVGSDIVAVQPRDYVLNVWYRRQNFQFKYTLLLLFSL